VRAVSSVVPLVGGCGFELEFVGGDGKRMKRALSASWDVAFDRLARPVRSFPSFRGQRSCSGRLTLIMPGSETPHLRMPSDDRHSRSFLYHRLY
jgi:hypothetical protein